MDDQPTGSELWRDQRPRASIGRLLLSGAAAVLWFCVALALGTLVVAAHAAPPGGASPDPYDTLKTMASLAGIVVPVAMGFMVFGGMRKQAEVAEKRHAELALEVSKQGDAQRQAMTELSKANHALETRLARLIGELRGEARAEAKYQGADSGDGT